MDELTGGQIEFKAGTNCKGNSQAFCQSIQTQLGNSQSVNTFKSPNGRGR